MLQLLNRLLADGNFTIFYFLNINLNHKKFKSLSKILEYGMMRLAQPPNYTYSYAPILPDVRKWAN